MKQKKITMKTSHPPIRRMIFIDQKLRENRYPNCSTVAREFEVNYKTIRRDIEYMRDQLGAPIDFDPRKNGYYYTEPDYYLPAVHLRESEIFSFLVAEKVLKQYQNTAYFAQLKTVVEKIMRFLPADLPLQEFTHLYEFQSAPTSPIDAHKYELVEKAVQEQRQIRLRYHSLHRDEISERQVDPYYILHKNGAWYFIGHCHRRQEPRIFALNRVLTVELLESGFSIPADFDKEKYLGDSFNIMRETKKYHVKLKFSPYQSRWITERKWHKTQQLTTLPDESVLLELDVTGLADLRRWVLQYGSEVEVLAPPELRQAIIQEIEKLTALYNQ